ncbi:GH16253 [Drosophila grimshawi]|uniref:GH16253 n=1 Tax=Drosophila grimshawi TaxID=7222 RepID=B4IXS8_DROGR|nr:GH16253 [Drosophila grimshawi]
MQVVSVVTLLLASIFAYSSCAPQFGPNLSSITLALAQLAQQLAQQSNSTARLSNSTSSATIPCLSNSIASANINVPNNNGLSPGWNNGWFNSWNGVLRGSPEYDGLPEDEESEMEGKDVDNQGDDEDENQIDEQD